jgi:hypothetical protein
VTGRFVGELKAQGEDEGQDKLNECFAITEQREVGGLIVEIGGEGAVLAFGFVGLWHVSSPFVWRWVGMRHREDNVLKDQANCERIGASPLNALECDFFYSGSPLIQTDPVHWPRKPYEYIGCITFSPLWNIECEDYIMGRVSRSLRL